MIPSGVSTWRIRPSSKIASRSPSRMASRRWCVTSTRVEWVPDVEPLEIVEELGSRRAVEGHERLVQQEQVRIEHQGSREAGALGLAARQLARRTVSQVEDPEALQPVVDTLAGLGRVHAPEAQAGGDVPEHRRREEQRGCEHQPDPPPVGELLPRDEREPVDDD